MATVEVFYKDQLAGLLSRQADDTCQFQYSEAYLDSQGPAISVTLPTRTEPYTTDGLFPFFDGLIPEGWLLNLASEKLRLNPLQDRYELLIRLCHDAIGAVSIGSPEADRPSRITQLPDGEMPAAASKCHICYNPLDASEVVYHTACMKQMFGRSVSPFVAIEHGLLEALAEDQINRKLAVTGVQKKLSLDLTGEGRARRLTLTNLWGRFIFKPPGTAPHLPENEHLCMRLAATAGIRVAESALIPIMEGELGYVARRFDRGERGEKYHQEDCCQMLDKAAYKKYSGSVEQIGKVLLQHSSFPGDNAYRLLQLVLFNFLIGNADAHLKNYSMSYEDGKNELKLLSPGYDLLSTDLYIDQDPEESALAINGRKNNLRRKDFESLAAQMKIPTRVFNNAIEHFREQMPAWHQLINLSFLPDDRKARLESLIDERFARLI